MVGLERGGEAHDHRHGGGAGPVAALLAADRFERGRVPDQQRADPRRPAELVGGDDEEIGVRQRQFAGALGAVDEQQAARGLDPRRDLDGGMDDSGLVVDRLDRDQRPLRPGQRGVEIGEVEGPVAPGRDLARVRDVRSTAGCSIAETMRVPALARRRTISIASVAPEVKMSVPVQPKAAAMRVRAASIAARTARPSAWAEEGFAQFSQALRIASAASGRIGVVEA